MVRRYEVGIGDGREPSLIYRERIFVPLWVTLLGRAAKGAGVVITRLVWWMIRHPVQVAAVLLVLVVRHAAGWLGVLAVLMLVLGCGLAWRRRWPFSYERHIGARARRWWRWRRVYSRRWAETMDGCGLVESGTRGVVLPQITRLQSFPDRDLVTVRLPAGQVPSDVAGACEAISHGLLAWRVSMAGTWPGRVALLVQWRDPLTAPISPELPMPGPVPSVDREAANR